MESISYKIHKNMYFLKHYAENIKTHLPTLKRNIKLFIENSKYKVQPHKRNLITVFIIVLIAFLVIKPICVFCYNYIFFYPVDRISQFNITNITTKATLENQYRATSIQFIAIIGGMIGSFAVLIGLFFAWGNLTVAREGQITDRFTRAVDQLGNKAPEIRLGGIHALGRISKESKKDYSTIIKILADYVRIRSNIYNRPGSNYPEYSSFSMDILANEITTNGILDSIVSTDIQAALEVIGERKSFFHNGKDKNLNLKETFLRGAYLSDLHLEGVILSWANLESAMLSGTHLDDAYLKGTNLKFARLITTELRGANLEKVDLSIAELSFARLEGANLKKAILKNTVLDGAHLEGANLEEANLEKAILVIAHLEGANLEGANLKEANLKLAHLEGTELWRANFEGAYLYGVSFENASFGQINFKGADLSSAIFKEVAFGYANFEDATLTHAKLEKANLIKCKLNRADLLGADIEGAYLMDADLRGAKLLGANLRGTYLDGADLSGADLRGARLGGACLKGAFLDRADLENANLEGANLENADIRRARNLSIDQLSKVKSLKGTKIDEELRIRLEDAHVEF